jgi:hypothetical protein
MLGRLSHAVIDGLEIVIKLATLACLWQVWRMLTWQGTAL